MTCGLKIDDKILTIDPDGSNVEIAHRMAEDIVDAIIGHFSTLNTKSVYKEVKINNQMPTALDWDNILEYLKEIISGSMQVGHPRFFGHMDSGPLFVSVLADWVASALNQNMLNPELSPLASRIEESLIQWLLGLVGYPHGDGALVSGGTMSNLMAVLLALHHISKGHFRQDGVWSLPGKPVIFTSDQAHYSVSKVASSTGLGEQCIVKIPTNSQFRMETSVLEQEIKHAEFEGKLPLMVVATAGTTSTGSVDPIPEIARICHSHNLWLHVDAAHGGGVLFSQRMKSILSGIELADSITIDPHKWLMQPKSMGVILTCHPGMLKSLFGHEAPYLHGSVSGTVPDWGNRGFQGSRRFDALRLWITKLYLGDDGLSKLVERGFENVSRWANILRENPKFEVPHLPDLNILCFRYRPTNVSEKEIDSLNDKIQRGLMKSGEGYVSSTTLKDHRWLRSVFLNPTITDLDMKIVKEKIEIIISDMK